MQKFTLFPFLIFSERFEPGNLAESTEQQIHFKKLEVLGPVCNGFGRINIGRGPALGGIFFSNFFFDLEKI